MLDFDFGLGEDIDLLRETVRDFAAAKSRRAPTRSIAATGFRATSGRSSANSGLLGITVEPEFGGSRSRLPRARRCDGGDQPRVRHRSACRTARTRICA